VPFDAPPEGGKLEVEASIFYCREGRDAVCLYHQTKIELPLRADPQGPDVVAVRIVAPGTAQAARQGS
jgi:hypothetical protein